MPRFAPIDVKDLPNGFIIAIDGTSGSGKSTIARGLCKELGLDLLETGAFYRAATLAALEADIDVHSEDSIVELLNIIDIHYDNDPYIDDRLVRDDIRESRVADNVSHVAVHPRVREIITNMTRKWIVDHRGGVIEGRDITTVVAPHARVALYIDAPEEIRAARRMSDSHDNVSNQSAQEIAENLAKRDHIDSSRATAPLTRKPGIWEIDTSLYTPEDIVSEIAKVYREGK